MCVEGRGVPLCFVELCHGTKEHEHQAVVSRSGQDTWSEHYPCRVRAVHHWVCVIERFRIFFSFSVFLCGSAHLHLRGQLETVSQLHSSAVSLTPCLGDPLRTGTSAPRETKNLSQDRTDALEISLVVVAWVSRTCVRCLTLAHTTTAQMSGDACHNA